MIFLSILIVSAIAAALAAVLVFVGRIVNDYGECTIQINEERSLKLDGGRTLLESLMTNKVFVPSACGGRSTCGECKLKVTEGGGPLLPTEEPYIEEEEREKGIRLACQVKVREDISIEIPEELFSVSEFTCVCSKIEDLTHDIKLFRLELKDPEEMNYVPGQYIQLLCPAYDGNEEVYRAYSISSDSTRKNVIDLIIRLAPGGICTTWCFEHLSEGDEVKINGPYGKFELSDSDAPILFVAGGTGLAPIRCMLHHMRNTNNERKAAFFFGADVVKDLFYVEQMKEFEKDIKNFTFVPVVAAPADGEKWDGETGLVTEALERNVKDASEHEGYLCGSPGMIDAAVGVLKKLGMPEDKILFDKFE